MQTAGKTSWSSCFSSTVNTSCLFKNGGFKYLLFLPLPGEMIQFDEHMFQMAWFKCFFSSALSDGWYFHRHVGFKS